MTTPHFIVEELRAYAPIRKMFNELGAADGQGDCYPNIEVLSDLYGRAVHFDFNDIRPTEEHKEFGEELYKNGMFILPYPQLFVTSNIFKGDDISILYVEGDNCIEAFVAGPLSNKVKGVAIHEREYILPKSSYRIRYVGGGEWPFYFDYGMMSHMLKPPSRERQHETAALIFGLMFSWVTMLMGKEVEQRIEPPPAKLNKIRERAGKPRINERRLILVRPHARHALLGEPGESGRTVVPHFRRGHFRRLAAPRKADGIAVVPVAPTLVNADYDNMQAPRDYVVKP